MKQLKISFKIVIKFSSARKGGDGEGDLNEAEKAMLVSRNARFALFITGLITTTYMKVHSLVLFGKIL